MATNLITTRATISKRNFKRASEKVSEVFPTEIHLSARDGKLFLAALTKPPKPNAKLKKAMAKFKKMTEKSL